MSWTRSLWGFEHWSRQGDKELTPVTWTIACSRGLMVSLGFPGGSVVKNLSANARNAGLIPGWGRFPGEENGKLLQYSCLENPMDGGAWQAIVHVVAKSRTQLSDWAHTYTHTVGAFCTQLRSGLGFPHVEGARKRPNYCLLAVAGVEGGRESSPGGTRAKLSPGLVTGSGTTPVSLWEWTLNY